MKPMICKINPDRGYFYCLVLIGYFLPDRATNVMLEEVFGITWAAGMSTHSEVNGKWRRYDDRSVLRAIVAIAENSTYRPAQLPKSGSQIRKNRPDLAQYFPDDFHGWERITIGGHIIDFVVGWPTEQAAEQALQELRVLDTADALKNAADALPTASNNFYYEYLRQLLLTK